MEKPLNRLPPSDNGEWWEIGDESRGGIPYYYHTKTGETVWEKPDGFVIPLTVLQVRPLSLSFRGELKLSPPPRIPPWVVVSPSHFLQPRIRIRRRLHVQRYKSNALLWLTVHVHTRRKPGHLLMPLVGFRLLQVLLLLSPKRTQVVPLCDATLPPILIILPRRAWRRRFRQSPVQRRAPRLLQPLPTAPSSLSDHRLSR